ncbi:LacI family DNA-binding transcriptional regulator [Microbacterium trichothecenolyticum]|uniref:LacI family DNA-binding transcriptional regulator n=1 Tax=Microbacterium trichothecenolyticum TaxID=69370 RepID=UPI00286C9924|nr:LacI family DNA-binding transcriptional regulator [Microbacterium trichothecenolyticum]
MTEPVPADRKRPSIYDVAARAGVSHMTVSRVLNGRRASDPRRSGACSSRSTS